MERVSAYAEGVRHERAMSESAAHGESTWTRKRTTAEGLMGRFWTFYSKVAQAYGVCNLRERIAPLRRLSSALSALILCELGRGSWIPFTPALPGPKRAVGCPSRRRRYPHPQICANPKTR